jgi:hypothetical protein
MRACVGEVERKRQTTANHVQHVFKMYQALPPPSFLIWRAWREASQLVGYFV